MYLIKAVMFYVRLIAKGKEESAPEIFVPKKIISLNTISD